MPKVATIDLRINEYAKYNIHYNKKDDFFIKSEDLPSDFVAMMGRFQGYKTFDELEKELLVAVKSYQSMRQSEVLVICYGASASEDILMNCKQDGTFVGMLPNCSKKIKNRSNKTSVGIEYDIFKKFCYPDGNHRYQRFNLDTQELHSSRYSFGSLNLSNEMPYTTEAHAFFKSMVAAMANMVVQLSKIIDATPDQFAAIVASQPKMISMGGGDQHNSED